MDPWSALTAVAGTWLFLLSGLGSVEAQRIPCQRNGDCRRKNVKSTCLRDAGSNEGTCSNPYAQGCLSAMLLDWPKVRVCNSQDDAAAVARGDCRPTTGRADFEIRLFAENWESAFLEDWLLQIILSELLDVPTSMETGRPNADMNLYHATAALDYGTSNDLEALEHAHYGGGDCRILSAQNDEAARQSAVDGEMHGYVSCAHFIPEVWDTQLASTQGLLYAGVLEPPQALGVLGQEAWFIPKFLAQENPALLSYLGLQGPDQRQLLADTFKRPTTWGDYCTLLSAHNCTIPDGVAARAPINDWERNRMFDEDNMLYTGHFRYTDKNNCTLFPDNCTGHIADYPCGWSSYTAAQTHYLDIALDGDEEARSYDYWQLRELWLAANWTKSPLIMQWWTPEQLYQTFRGTDAEFVRVVLPSPTQECIEHRLKPGDRCSDDFATRVGDAKGVCDEAVRPLQKLILARLYEDLNDPSISEAIRSPAHDVLRLFSVSELQLDDIFRYWTEMGDPRQAVCTWAAENVDTYLRDFVPRNYPRVEQEEKRNGGALQYVSIALGGLVVLLVMVTAFGVHQYRDRRPIQVAQVQFLWILLIGSFLVALGAILAGTPPTNGTCLAEIWLIDVGYSLGLVPLIVKVAAVHRVIGASERYRRVHLNQKSLFGIVAIISALVMVILLLCTVFDPPRKTPEYQLTDSVLDSGETIVKVRYYCSTDSRVWRLVPIAWYMVLLLSASVLAFQVRNHTKAEFTESRTLPTLIYSHFMFAVIRLALSLLTTDKAYHESNSWAWRQIRSLIVSADTLAALIIFFLPKLVAAITWTEEPRQGLSSHILVGFNNRVVRWISSLPSMSLSNSIPSQTDHAVAVERVAQVSFTEEQEEGNVTGRSQKSSSAADNSKRDGRKNRESPLSALEEADRSGETKQSLDPESGAVTAESSENSESRLVSLLQKKVYEQEETIALLKDQMANLSKTDMLGSGGAVDEC